jgi:hypothetical protein
MCFDNSNTQQLLSNFVCVNSNVYELVYFNPKKWVIFLSHFPENWVIESFSTLLKAT